jgi:RHS repeat-associated protein
MHYQELVNKFKNIESLKDANLIYKKFYNECLKHDLEIIISSKNSSNSQTFPIFKTIKNIPQIKTLFEYSNFSVLNPKLFQKMQNDKIQVGYDYSISFDLNSARYLHDLLNNRTSKIPKGFHELISFFITDDIQLDYVLYLVENITKDIDANNKTQHLATIVHHPTQTDTPLSITNHETNKTYYYHRDHQGSIVALSNEEGNIVESIVYDGHYGTILHHHKDEVTHNPYGYTGRETDMEDLYYYRARYYDPQTQRFLSRDPIEFEAGDFNFYRYVGNDCVNFRDPSGLKPGDKFGTEKGAAKDVLDSINPKSITKNIEHTGWILKNKDGTYTATKPVGGTVDSAGDSGGKPPNACAGYHTHGSDKKGPNGEVYDHENFSPEDKEFAKSYKTNEWLGTPWGVTKKYNVKTGKITTEGKIKVK